MCYIYILFNLTKQNERLNYYVQIHRNSSYIQNKLIEIRNELMHVSIMHFKLNSFQDLILHYYNIDL